MLHFEEITNIDFMIITGLKVSSWLSALALYITVTVIVCQEQVKHPPVENKLDWFS